MLEYFIYFKEINISSASSRINTHLIEALFVRTHTLERCICIMIHFFKAREIYHIVRDQFIQCNTKICIYKSLLKITKKRIFFKIKLAN